MSKFTWVEAHKKICEWLLNREAKQLELVSILSQLGISPLNDRDIGDTQVPLTEIDPFTFFAYLYKYDQERRLKNLQALCKFLHIEPMPLDDDGIPSVYAQNVWLFPYKKDRQKTEIPLLWKLFRAALTNGITDDLFNTALKIKGTGTAKLTEALFYVQPNEFLPIDGQTRPYLEREWGVDCDFATFSDYTKKLGEVREKTQKPFPELSHTAYVENKKRQKVAYWVFQANPDLFDLKKALSDDLIEHWTVTAHKDSIKPGDKVIIWQTGSAAGCYALAEITIGPHVPSYQRDEHLWKATDKSELKAGIRITHNLADRPILKARVDTIAELANLKIGQRGTNFSSSVEEYETMANLAEENADRQYWVYAPGPNADFWEDFYRDGIMAIGWDSTGDLKKLRNREEINEKLRNEKGSEGSRKNDTTACDDLANVMQIGDMIFAKRGQREYLGFGIVKSDYYFDASRKEYKHCRKVAWQNKGTFPADHQIVLKTLTNITTYADYVEKLKAMFNQSKAARTSLNSDLPKNIILYGPPGTGKTYSSISRAVEIIAGAQPSNHASAKAEFDSLRAAGQIAFVTFHQNYSYEDFMVGIRPKTDTDGALGFITQNGIFYEICKRARANYENAMKGTNRLRPFAEVFGEFIRPVELEGKEIEVKMTSDTHSFWITEMTDYSLKFRKQSGGTAHSLSLASLQDFYEGTRDHFTSGLGVYYRPLVAHLQQLGSQSGSADPLRNYVLVIDEINRANISRVFGELITLLEEDKRLGQENELRVTLANGSEFAVPPNLYVLGTMNTADKSIALVDIALRRRFSFEGMYPDYTVLSGEVTALLRQLNAAIYSEKKSADYLIGHAYFMKNEDTAGVLENKVIPLMMEYFAGRVEKVEQSFANTGWAVKYDTQTYQWKVSRL